jgi:3-oxoacyl-[acyl-carrier-protein] synthase I
MASLTPSAPSLLALQSMGAVTNIGHSAVQTLASWINQTRCTRRLRLPGFADPFTLADCALLTEGQQGAQRLNTLLTSAVLEALEAATAPVAAERTLTLLVLPAWADESQQAQVQSHLVRLTPANSPPPLVFKGGSIATLEALAHAHNAVAKTSNLQRVILAAVDSACEPAALQAAASAGWLLQSGNGQGFVPGEAAACMVLAPVRSARELPASGFALHAPFMAKADTRWWPSAQPPQHTLVTAALAGALKNAGMTGAHISHLQSDMDGSDWRAQLEAEALGRTVLKGAQSKLPHWAPAELWGQVGAAHSLLGCMLAAQSHAHDIERINTQLNWTIDPAGQAGAVVMERSPH